MSRRQRTLNLHVIKINLQMFLNFIEKEQATAERLVSENAVCVYSNKDYLLWMA